MNNTPKPHNEAHAAALEAYRVAHVAVDRWLSLDKLARGPHNLDHDPEYQALLEERDAARAAVVAADPKAKA